MNGQEQFFNYVGTFMGFQEKNRGNKKDGSEWIKYDVLFHHGDMTKPIRFTSFDTPLLINLQPMTVYRVLYVETPFTLPDGTPAKSKKAVKIVPSTGEKLGFQQEQVINQPEQALNTPQQQIPVQTTQSNPQQNTGLDVSDYANHLKAYKETYDPELWNRYHYIVTYLLAKLPTVKDQIKQLAGYFDQNTQQQEQVIQDV